MRKWIVPAAAILFGWTAPAAPAADLNVGDAAPKLAVKEFVKGNPIKDLEKGKIYVVEFWATWCGPCRTSIPHLTELQKKYKDVAFIGVSISERKPEGVKPFVEEMGDKMGYRVALDDNDAMSRTWMEAAGQEGIPTAFIVNGEGKIAWIGHPLSMDKPLDQVASGKWDLAAAARTYRTELAQRRKLRELREKLTRAEKSGDPKEVVAVVDQAIADDPQMEKQVGLLKFKALAADAGSVDKALAYGKRLVETVLADNAQGLNFVAWTVVDPDAKTKPDAKLLKLALQAAQQADDLVKGRDAGIADTLALAYFDNGNAAKALETQERALKLAEGTPLATDPDLKRRLEQYKKAARKE
jgi:thiol-disulfide isomerase/thioredoxin